VLDGGLDRMPHVKAPAVHRIGNGSDTDDQGSDAAF
jgi:hypothetical protein